MSILIRCVQFGRRHLWPHLLLGVVAAGVSSASTVNEAHPESPANPAISRSAQPALTNSAMRLRHELIALSAPSVALHASITQPEQASVQDWRPVSGFFARLAKILAPYTPHASLYASVWWPESVADLRVEPVLSEVPVALLLPTYCVLFSAALRLAQPWPRPYPRYAVVPAAFNAYLPSRWLAQVQGIRAGPLGLA